MVNLDAYAYYLRARSEWLNFQTLERYKPGQTSHLKKARELFNASIQLDSGYSPAWSGLAMTFLSQRFFDISNDSLSLVYAEKALALDSRNDEAHEVRGSLFVRKNDYDNGLHELGEAVRINPNNSGALTSLAWAKVVNLNFREAMEFINKAIERSQGPELVSCYEQAGGIFQTLGFL